MASATLKRSSLGVLVGIIAAIVAVVVLVGWWMFGGDDESTPATRTVVARTGGGANRTSCPPCPECPPAGSFKTRHEFADFADKCVLVLAETPEKANFSWYVLGVGAEITVFTPSGKKFAQTAGELVETHEDPSSTSWRFCAKNAAAEKIDIWQQ